MLNSISQGLSATQLSDPQEIVNAFKQAEQAELVGLREVRAVLVIIVIIITIIISLAYTQNTYGTNTYRYSFRR